MTKNILFIIFSCCFTCLFAQPSGDDVLFTVDGDPVTVSEFDYIYAKTNGKKATYTRASLEEYLDLYTRFKLKVKRAKDLKLDTIQSLNEELKGYRQQLANSYLIENEVTRKLAEEVYDRMQYDVDVSHTFIQIPRNGDTTGAYNISKKVIDKLENGEDFIKLVRETSDDNTSKESGGRIGYVTAMLPEGFYDFETAAYSLKVGEFSRKPIRSNNGYHVIMLNDKRPARGKIEAAHILVRTKDRSKDAAKKLIDSLYTALQDGADFDQIAATYSEDKNTAKKGGRLGRFGINSYESDFENAAFAIKEVGGISKPVQTRIGWHIIKKLSSKEEESFESMYPLLKVQLQRRPRHQEAELAIIERLKKEAKYKLNEDVYNEFLDSLGIDFLTHRWSVPNYENGDATLFSLEGGDKVSLKEFALLASRNTRERLRGTERNPTVVARNILDLVAKEKVLDHAKKELEKRYPEFKSLMREYEEGILLFEATKRMVWDKATEDTTGLKEYFANNREEYKWGDRAEVVTYTVLPNATDKLQDIIEAARSMKSVDVLNKFNNPETTYILAQKKVLEKDRSPEFDKLLFKEGSLSSVTKDKNSKIYTFMKLEKIIDASPKSLDEARGFIIADYQDHLDAKWVKELEKQYPVKIKKKVFDEMVRQ